jgi:hypothetical protein
MKTTIDIPEALLHEARRIADEKGVTLKALVEQGLRHVLERELTAKQVFRMRKHTFRGNGLRPDLADADWSEIRRRAYEGRGG